MSCQYTHWRTIHHFIPDVISFRNLKILMDHLKRYNTCLIIIINTHGITWLRLRLNCGLQNIQTSPETQSGLLAFSVYIRWNEKYQNSPFIPFKSTKKRWNHASQTVSNTQSVCLTAQTDWTENQLGVSDLTPKLR